MAENNNSTIPTWVMITIFLVITSLLAIFGDLFTFILGTFIQILVFAAGYNKSQASHH